MKSLSERLWAKTNRRGTDDCWIWQGNRLPRGYGQFGVGHTRKVYAHRISWELANGPIPPGMYVLHHCDVPACVNPAHLFLGTAADNARDMISKGRQAPPELTTRRGEASGSAKLTQAQVESLRAEYRRYSRVSGSRQLATKYGVYDSTIRKIVHGDTWRDGLR